MKSIYLSLILILQGTYLLAQVEALHTFKAHTRSYGLEDAVFSPNQKNILTCGRDGTVKLWNLQGELQQTFEVNKEKEPKCVAFSPDGKFIAASGYEAKIKIWNVKSAKLLQEIECPEYIYDLVFTPDSKKILAAGGANYVGLWEVKTGQKVKEFRARGIQCQKVDISPDGKTIVTGGGIGLKYWNLETGEEIMVFEDLKYEPDAPSPRHVNSARFSPDGQQILTWYDGDYINNYPKMQLWGIKGTFVQEFKGISGGFDAVMSPDRKYIIQGGAHHSREKFDYNNGRINVYEVSSGDQVYSFPAHANGIRSLQFSKDGKYVLSTGSKDREVKVWEYATILQEVRNPTPTSVKSTDSPASNAAKPDTKPMNEDEAIAIFEDLLKEQEDITYHALIISVQDYESESINDLKEPTKDAQALKKVLQNYYTFDASNITLLQNPKRADIIRALDELSLKVKPQDNLLIFYAGHGHWDSTLEQGYWLPADAEKDFRANWLANSELGNYIRGIKTKHTLLITDACFGGSIFEEATRAAFDNAPKYIKNLYERQSRQAMTSGTKELVPDKSIFVEYLLKGLEANTTSYLSAGSLFEYVREPVLSNTNNAPQFGAIRNTQHEGGDFIFIKK